MQRIALEKKIRVYLKLLQASNVKKRNYKGEKLVGRVPWTQLWGKYNLPFGSTVHYHSVSLFYGYSTAAMQITFGL